MVEFRVGGLRPTGRGSWDVVAEQEQRGPGKGKGSLLNAEQQEAIQALIRAHTLDATDLPLVLWSRLAMTALNANTVRLMERLVRDAPRKVFLNLGKLKVHEVPPVVAWLIEHQDRIAVFYLLSYSLTLHPGRTVERGLEKQF